MFLCLMCFLSKLTPRQTILSWSVFFMVIYGVCAQLGACFDTWAQMYLGRLQVGLGHGQPHFVSNIDNKKNFEKIISYTTIYCDRMNILPTKNLSFSLTWTFSKSAKVNLWLITFLNPWTLSWLNSWAPYSTDHHHEENIQGLFSGNLQNWSLLLSHFTYPDWSHKEVANQKVHVAHILKSSKEVDPSQKNCGISFKSIL